MYNKPCPGCPLNIPLPQRKRKREAHEHHSKVLVVVPSAKDSPARIKKKYPHLTHMTFLKDDFSTVAQLTNQSSSPFTPPGHTPHSSEEPSPLTDDTNLLKKLLNNPAYYDDALR